MAGKRRPTTRRAALLVGIIALALVGAGCSSDNTSGDPSPAESTQLTIDGPGTDLLALDEALTELGKKKPEIMELVKLRYFAGLTVDEAAHALGIASSTADRHWTYARAWLYRRLVPEDDL